MANYTKQLLTPGILGGMGPHAHIVLEENLLEINAKKYNAIKDRDHPVWITISATDIPDRTESIKGNAEIVLLNSFNIVISLNVRVPTSSSYHAILHTLFSHRYKRKFVLQF